MINRKVFVKTTTGPDKTARPASFTMNEFMASSDKVNPKFVRGTNVASEKRKGSEEVLMRKVIA